MNEIDKIKGDIKDGDSVKLAKAFEKEMIKSGYEANELTTKVSEALSLLVGQRDKPRDYSIASISFNASMLELSDKIEKTGDTSVYLIPICIGKAEIMIPINIDAIRSKCNCSGIAVAPKAKYDNYTFERQLILPMLKSLLEKSLIRKVNNDLSRSINSLFSKGGDNV